MKHPYNPKAIANTDEKGTYIFFVLSNKSFIKKILHMYKCIKKCSFTQHPNDPNAEANTDKKKMYIFFV